MLGFVALVPLVVGGWWQMRDTARAAARDRTAVVAEQAARRLEDFLRARLRMVELVRDQYVNGTAADQDNFTLLSQSLREEFEGFRAINWLDESCTIRWVTPLLGNASALGHCVLENPIAASAITAARDLRVPQMTQPLQLHQGGRAFTTYFPTVDDPELETSYINGVFLIDPLIEESLERGVLDRYRVVILDGDARVYGAPQEFRELADQRVVASSELELLGRAWSLSLLPTAATWKSMRAEGDKAILIGGFMLALALAALARVSLQRRAQAEQAASERRTLEAQLQQAQKMEAIGQLAGGVAHDFNNILTAITGYTDLLIEDDGINSSQRECLESIRLGGERATQLTSQLLTFSRKGKTKVVDLDLNTELESLQGMLGRLVRDDIMLGFEFGSDLGQIRMDQGQFSQVVINLVVNACDAVQGGGRIELDTRRAIRERDGVFNSWNVLSVRDSGTGMDEATLERVFEPFFTTKAVGKGTGLGLATTYGIVTSSGGAIEVHSELGVGTCFEVWLPVSKAAPAIVAPIPVETPSQFSGRVLIVEDDPSVLKITTRIIEDAGMEVLQACDGAEGLRVIESGAALDLVLTDAVMPNMNGLELVQAARDVRPGLPVIVCSGYAADDLHRDLMGLGVDFLEKPYSAKGLVELLGQHLSQSSQPS